jgi:hypothetical protein
MYLNSVETVRELGYIQKGSGESGADVLSEQGFYHHEEEDHLTAHCLLGQIFSEKQCQ